jgi:CHRD domain
MFRRSMIALGAALVLATAGTAPAAAEQIPYHAVLRPSSVVSDTGEPNLGDPDGHGVFGLDLDNVSGEVCVASVLSGIAAPTAARVHVGPEGTNGPVAFDLPTPPLGESEIVCATVVDPAVVQLVVANPSAFHVIVSTDEYPEGAIRGQLFLLVLCDIAAWGPDSVEGTFTLPVWEGETAVVGGWFATGSHVLVTIERDGVLVSSEVLEPIEDPAVGFARLHLEFAFANGDNGEWTVRVQDPTIGDCEGSVTITVLDFFGPDPEAPGEGATTGPGSTGGTTTVAAVGGGATAGTQLPNTAAVPPLGADAHIAIAGAALVLLAVASRTRRARSSRVPSA